MSPEHPTNFVFNRLAKSNLGRVISSQVDKAPLALVIGVNGNSQLAVLRPDGSGSIFETDPKWLNPDQSNKQEFIEKYLSALFHSVYDEDPIDDDDLLTASCSYTPSNNVLRIVASTALNPEQFATQIENAVRDKLKEQRIARTRVLNAMKNLDDLSISINDNS